MVHPYNEIKSLIKNNTDILIAKISEIQKRQNPTLFDAYIKQGDFVSTNNQLSFLVESISLKDKALFINYVNWLKKYYIDNRIPEKLIPFTLNAIREAVGEVFGEDIHKVVETSITAGLEQLGKPSIEVETYINISNPNGDLAFEYNLSLLNGDRKRASELILNAVENGIEIKDIYLDVFQASQYEVGRLWLDNKITVAKEHFCTAATQQIMSQLYPYIFNTERNGKSFVAANVGKELHEIGVRMVADFFEMDGWDTYYLGSNTPTSSIIEAIEENNAQVVGLSIAMWFHLPVLKKVIEELRERYDNNIKILVGGLAFDKSKEKWREIHADGYAKDALGAIELANRILKG